VAGTSIGGIIALGLALGRSAAEVRAIVEDAGVRVFPPAPWRGVVGLFRARYSAAPLREVIESVVGTDARLGDLRVPLLVPAVALTAGAGQTFRSPHHAAHALHADTRLVDVALTTAAAPVVFPVARVGDAEYVDGGLIAHAPDALALHEAEVFFARRREDVFMLSVGTTRELAALPAGGNPSRGLLWWMRGNRLPETVMGAQQALSQQVAREALGERYLAINTPRSRHQAAAVAIDRAGERAVATLKAMARHALEDVAEDRRVTRFLAHAARRSGGGA
jgi:patatin-like phospholipase/acyl hydrolase